MQPERLPDVTVNHAHHLGRSLARLSRRAPALLGRCAAFALADTIATSKPHAGTPPKALREMLRATALPGRLPHTIHLCVHCKERPAGFWVSRSGVSTPRRPWCLSCCDELDRDCRVIQFDS